MGRKRKELPPGFRELFPVMKNRELAARFGVNIGCIGTWGRKAGLKKALTSMLANLTKNITKHKKNASAKNV